MFTHMLMMCSLNHFTSVKLHGVTVLKSVLQICKQITYLKYTVLWV